MTRDERQQLCVQNWINADKKGIIVAAPGFGKTRVASMCIDLVDDKSKVLVIVPTNYLKQQWESRVKDVRIEVVNSIQNKQLEVDLLVLDEVHCYASDERIKLFSNIKYNQILGLTGTLERVDNKHKNIPLSVIDTVSVNECLKHNWISNYIEYDVLLTVPNIHEYDSISKQCNSFFATFGFDFDLATRCLNKSEALKYAERMRMDVKDVQQNAVMFMNFLQKRIAFINNHEVKLQAAKAIIEHHKDSKIITFSQNIKTCNKLKKLVGGEVYHSKMDNYKRNKIIKNIDNISIIHTAKAFNMGADVANLDVAIILGASSSKIDRQQRRGRVTRKENDKIAYVYNLILESTQEENWYKKSKSDEKTIRIKFEDLLVLW